MSSLSLIIRREYLSRVRRKSFVISTLLLPLLFVGLMALPTLIATMSTPEGKKIAVIDETASLSKVLLGNPVIDFEITEQNLDSLRHREDLDAILVIPQDIYTHPDKAELYTTASPSPQTEAYISGLLSQGIEQEKLSSYDIEGLEAIINDIHTNVILKTFRIDGESEQESSSTASYILGLLLTFVLYMFIMMYGQMIMTSIIEEKNNRVLEIVVSSVKPTTLMLGKIFGIGAVALTQILIWAVIIGFFSFTVMPGLISGALTAGADIEMTQILGTIGDPVYIMGLFGMMTLFLIFGYLFYSAIYTVIGSAVDNVQDASQLQMFALLPIILGMVFAMTILNDPGSDMAVWLSIVPFTSPMVMMARLPFGVPVWQTLVSLCVLVVTMLFTVWCAAKIYRIGIFMYGKKPSIHEIIRWARYK